MPSRAAIVRMLAAAALLSGGVLIGRATASKPAIAVGSRVSVTMPTGALVTGANGTGKASPVLQTKTYRLVRIGSGAEPAGSAPTTITIDGDTSRRLVLVED